jgi:hypothetical protein
LYAVHSTGVECIDGKFHCEPDEAKELQRQLKIDERCFKFGKFAVITSAVPFINRLEKALKSEGYKARKGLVKYYDEEVFHGEIPVNEIPFKKQKRFSYQREFRLCVDTGIKQDSAITINIGDISDICAKADAARLPGLLELKREPSPPGGSPDPRIPGSKGHPRRGSGAVVWRADEVPEPSR